jgi:putative flippase GtrA
MPDKNILIKYIFNGFLATAIHFSVLTFNLKILHIQSAGLASFVAAFFGIVFSFIGNRYFVFKSSNLTLTYQAAKFFLLYGLIACIHGVFLFVWSDLMLLDYRLGFLAATFFQFIFSYMGNKKIVFN